jgi:hypothetical protein
MDMGGNDEEPSINNSMCTEETPTVVEVEEELLITGHDFTNNDMDYTYSTIPTTITATDQTNGDFTPVRNGSPNRQSTQKRRNTTTTTNNSFSVYNSMCTTVVGGQLMEYTHSPIPTAITATNQSNDEFTPVRNGSPNRQSTLERRNTTTTTNNSRLLQQQRRATTTTITTTLTHLQKTDMIKTMIRGNQEDRVGLV